MRHQSVLVLEACEDEQEWASSRCHDQGDLRAAVQAALAERDVEPAEHPALVRDLLKGRVLDLGEHRWLRIRKRTVHLPARYCSARCRQSPYLAHWLGHDGVGTKTAHVLIRAGLQLVEHIESAMAEGAVADLRTIGPACLDRIEERLRDVEWPLRGAVARVRHVLSELEELRDYRPELAQDERFTLAVQDLRSFAEHAGEGAGGAEPTPDLSQHDHDPTVFVRN